MPIRLPSVTGYIIPTTQQQINQEERILFVGQKTSSGTAVSGELYQNIGNDASWDALFGKNSMLAAMIRAARLINNISRIDAIPLADNVSGVSAMGSITFSEAAESGDIYLSIGSERNNTYTVTIANAKTGAEIATDFKALIDVDLTSSVVASLLTQISAVAFDGIGLDDLTTSGTYTGTTQKTYIIEIDDADIPDTFRWSDDNGVTWTNGVAITGAPQLLSNGISIEFGATTGHTLGDSWSFIADKNILQLEAVNKGLEGNFITLMLRSTIVGYAVTITAMTGGANNPVLTDLFLPISKIRYQNIVYPSTYTLTVLTDLLTPRWNTINNVLDGRGILSKTDTKVNLETYLNGLNNQSLVFHCNKKIDKANHKGSALVEFNSVIASEVGAISALRLTDGSDLSQYNISSGGLRDVTGGSAIASFPLFNTPMPYLLPIQIGNEWEDTDVTDLKEAGGFVLGNNKNETGIIFGEVVTTYKTDAAGNDDITYKYLEYVQTYSEAREYFVNNCRAQYAQCRLTNGELIEGRKMANAASISSFFDKLYTDLSSVNYVLTPIGVDTETDVNWMAYFKQNKVVTLNMGNGSAIVTMKLPILTQLRTIVFSMQVGVNFSN